MRLDSKPHEAKRLEERGMSLLEVMMAMIIIAIGLTAITQLLVVAIGTNNRNSRDTTATLLAQKVIEQIAAVSPAAPTSVAITDCNGNSHTVNTTDAAGPSGAGATLVTSSSSMYYGSIDQSQSSSSIPTGYAMSYVDCSVSGGTQTIYDVRWNVMTLRSGFTRLITVTARPAVSSSGLLGGRLFAIPVSLRSIAGNP